MNKTMLWISCVVSFFILIVLCNCSTKTVMIVCPEFKKLPGSLYTDEIICKNYQQAVARLAQDGMMVDRNGDPMTLKYNKAPDLYESFFRERSIILSRVAKREKADVLFFGIIQPAVNSHIGYIYSPYAYSKSSGITFSLPTTSSPILEENFRMEFFWVGSFISLLEKLEGGLQ